MINAGDIHLADLNEERRRRVLVISNARFQRVSGRVLVAPEIIGEPDEVPFPWRVEVDDAVYAVDLVRSLPTERLLDRTDRAPSAAMAVVRRALLNIT
ncbi:MAG: type II toxin-antitoxin system PemK/MazF family toxin [Acidimicrobiia bacterium]